MPLRRTFAPTLLAVALAACTGAACTAPASPADLELDSPDAATGPRAPGLHSDLAGSDGDVTSDAGALVDLASSGADLSPPPYGTQRAVPIDDTALFGAAPPNGYYEYVPSEYAASGARKWPLVIMLHGIGQLGDGKLVGPGTPTKGHLEALLTTGLTKLIDEGKLPIPNDAVVLSPQGASYFTPAKITAFLAWAKAHYRVEPKRLYLTGLSYGGMASWDYVQARGDAGEFAAVVPISGDGTGQAVTCAQFATTPLWAFHGDADANYPTRVALDEAAYAAIKGCSPAPTAPIKLTIYPGVGHNSWDLTYSLSGMAHSTSPAYDPYDISVYTWMLAQSKP